MSQGNYIAAGDAKLLELSPLPREPWDIRVRTPASPRIFSTLLYERSEQFDVWRARVSSLADVERPKGANAAEGFKVEYMTCNMADVVLSAGHFAAQSIARASEASRKARIDHWWLFHVRSGEAWFQTGDRQIQAQRGAMFLISLDDDFRGRITDFDGLVMQLPRDVFAQVEEGMDSLCNTLLSGNLIEFLADYLINLETRVIHMNADELRKVGRVTAEMISACLQPSADRLEQVRSSIDSMLFERARLYIRNHLGDYDLSPERVARQLRISRSNLYRAFEHVGGVARFIQHKRLRMAHAELIASPEKQVQEIAYRNGFRLTRDFARAFRREFGVSPREARERARR
jgi:AraC-like DNA-binding protein